MSTNETALLEKVVEKTQSELITFFVILLISLVAVFIPLYILILRDRKEKNKMESERQTILVDREKQIIQVITANTEAMASLKVTLETSGVSTTFALESIKKNINSIDDKINNLSNDVRKAIDGIDRLLEEKLA